MLADPAGLIEGEGKRTRHAKPRPGKELDDEALSDLIAAAYQDIRRRLNPLGGSAEGAIHRPCPMKRRIALR